MTPKEQAEQALKDAGYERYPYETDEWVSYHRDRADGYVDLVRLPTVGSARLVEVCTWGTLENFMDILNPISLEDDERKALEWAINHLIEDGAHRIAPVRMLTLRGLLSRLKPTKEG